MGKLFSNEMWHNIEQIGAGVITIICAIFILWAFIEDMFKRRG